jgi:hypothetical protein
MREPLNNLGWGGDIKKITGSAFAILGKKPLRMYWSSALRPMNKPNFHQPKRFAPLFN